MRSLIILKGLVKRDKLDWVKKERLENYFVDINVLRRMFSTPDLVTSTREVLNKSFGNLVYQRFIEIVCTKFSKGCLVVVDTEGEAYSILETLSFIYGYTIFSVIKNTPKDYIKNNRKYKLPYYTEKKKAEIQKDITNFNKNTDNYIKITHYSDVLNYWKKQIKKQTIRVKDSDYILHVSDIHSNFSLFNSLPDFNNYTNLIFYGDYIDGREQQGSINMIDFIYNSKQKNIIWLEGNHELRLRRYLGCIILRGSGKKDYIQNYLFDNLPEDFLESTALEFSDIKPDKARNYLDMFNNKLKMFALININKDLYISSHAGLKFKEEIDPKFIGNLIYRNADVNKVDKEFTTINKNTSIYSIHAHCKYDDLSINKYDKVFNLDPPTDTNIIYAEQQNKNWNICLLEREM